MLDGGYNAAQAASARSFLPLPGGIYVSVCMCVCLSVHIEMVEMAET